MNCQMFSVGFNSGALPAKAGGDVVGEAEFGRGVPSGLIEDEDGMCAGTDGCADFGQMDAIASVLHHGRTRPMASPFAGQIAPKR